MKGPFQTVPLNKETTKMEPGWQPTSIEFSSDGMDLLMATDRNVIMLLDGYEGELVSSMSCMFAWLLIFLWSEKNVHGTYN
jgi:hypothetical protein